MKWCWWKHTCVLRGKNIKDEMQTSKVLDSTDLRFLFNMIVESSSDTCSIDASEEEQPSIALGCLLGWSFGNDPTVLKQRHEIRHISNLKD